MEFLQWCSEEGWDFVLILSYLLIKPYPSVFSVLIFPISLRFFVASRRRMTWYENKIATIVNATTAIFHLEPTNVIRLNRIQFTGFKNNNCVYLGGGNKCIFRCRPLCIKRH